MQAENSFFSSDWEIYRVGELCESIVPGRNKPNNFDGDIPWITIADLDKFYIEESGEGLAVTKEEIKLCGNKIIPENAVIMSCIGQFGLVGITKREIVINQQLHAFVCSHELDSYFLATVLYMQQPYMERIATQTTIKYMNKASCESVPIPLPPLEEQRKIAAILGTWDKAIGLVEALIAALQERKKGLMQLLLTGDVRFPEFDGEWETANIEDIADIKGGKRLPKGESLVSYDTGFPYIRVSDMSEQGIDISNIMFVPPDVASLIDAYRIFKDDIYISVAGTIGLVGTIPVDLDGANLTENADRLTNIKMNRQFLLHTLKSSVVEQQIDRVLTTNAQPKLALTRIRKFQIPTPSPSEQKKIANVIDLVDSQIKAYIFYCDELQEQKKGLMQQLLTGQVRV